MKKLLFLLLILSAVSCKKDDPEEVQNNGEPILTVNVPRGFPYPVFPADNQPTQSRVDLGRKLFNDPILSRDSSVSCGSCHMPALGFTDGRARSIGIEGRLAGRNSMPILNVAYQPYFFWDGGSPTLEQQVLAPIENPNEMDFDVNFVVARLQNNPQYVAEFQRAYGQGPNVYTLTRAIACFERTIFSETSRFDIYMSGNDTTALTASEKRGMDLFFGERAECFHCHSGHMFSDFSFRNNGLYLNYADSGRARITTLSSDAGKFKVPSLRGLLLTAPYMHDGSMSTLEEVVDHYNSGGQPHPNKSGFIFPLGLSQQEKEDLVNFLKTL